MHYLGVSAPVLSTGTDHQEHCFLSSLGEQDWHAAHQEKEEDRSVTFGLAIQVQGIQVQATQVQGGPCDLHPWTVLHPASVAYIPKSAKRADSTLPP